MQPEYQRPFYTLKIEADVACVFKRATEFVLRTVNLSFVPSTFVKTGRENKISQWVKFKYETLGKSAQLSFYLQAYYSLLKVSRSG